MHDNCTMDCARDSIVSEYPIFVCPACRHSLPRRDQLAAVCDWLPVMQAAIDALRSWAESEVEHA